MHDSNEIEVDATHILKEKQLKLRTEDGTILLFYLDVFESETPYVMIFIIKTAHGHSTRMDIQKEDLACELRLWLEGKIIRNASVIASSRIEGAMQQFIKFGKTPKQEDLIMWILSRSELNWGNDPRLNFGGGSHMRENMFHEHNFTNQYPKTVEAATMSRSFRDINGSKFFASECINDIFTSTVNSNGNPQYTNSRSNSSFSENSNGTSTTRTKGQSRPIEYSNNEDLGTFELTRRLLGKSTALETLSKNKIKGRPGAKMGSGLSTLGAEHQLLGANIEKARKNIESAMEVRRRSLEVAKARNNQAAEKYLKIRAEINNKKKSENWIAAASQELFTLQKIHDDIQDDIKKQKNRTTRSTMKIGWTMAPNGTLNRRGKSFPGPVLGSGPLPPNATTHLRKPLSDSVVKYYYWDKCGRRHERTTQRNGDDSGDNVGDSLVDQAMEVIRRTAVNASSYKLDFRKVFDEFDTSRDGLLSFEEMADAFLRMGVRLDLDTMTAIFRHFDPNDSGSVHSGEFIWAFFNRRSMVRQWKRHTDGFSNEELVSKFHQFDLNGDGQLNFKEFKKLLLNFGIKITDDEQETLMNRFDNDQDGCINMIEFFIFIENEKNNLYLDPQHEAEELHRKVKKDHETKEEKEKEFMIHPPKVGPKTIFLHQNRENYYVENQEFSRQNRPKNPPPYMPEWDHSPARRVRSDDSYISVINENSNPNSSSSRERGRERGGGGGRSDNQDREDLYRREEGGKHQERMSERENCGENRKGIANTTNAGWSDVRQRGRQRQEQEQERGQEENDKERQGRSSSAFSLPPSGRYVAGDNEETGYGTRNSNMNIAERISFEINDDKYNQMNQSKEKNLNKNKHLNDNIDNYNNNTCNYKINRKAEDEEEFEYDDDTVISSEEAHWATKMLRAQAHLETRLGKNYY